MSNFKLPLAALTLAIAITTAMDFGGLLMFSAFPLIALTAIFWVLQRQSRAEIGLTLGSLRDHGLAVLYPAVVLGAATLVATVTGAASLEGVEWPKMTFNVTAGSAAGVLAVLLTEEGFFRGWLWGAFRKAGLSSSKTLWVTSLGFTAWHVSAVTSGSEYGLPWAQSPIYLANGTLLGLNWGLLRKLSGSIVVASVSHAIWNQFAYGFFGFGTKTGALGIENTLLYGPEVGLVGLALNGGFFLWLRSRVGQDDSTHHGPRQDRRPTGT